MDLEYPKELHKLHKNYPLVREKLAVKKECLSEYKTELLENKSIINVSKLVPKIVDNKKHVVHYRNLQLYRKQGI